MILFYSPNSPFARIARITLRETGLIAGTEEVLAINRAPDNPVLIYSPVGRVPTLVAGDLTITETRQVYDFIMDQAGIPLPPTDWSRVAFEGQVFGFMEGICAWIREERRGSSASAFLKQVENERIKRCLISLEQSEDLGQLLPFPYFAAVTLASSLELLDTFHARSGWTEAYPKLATWFRSIENRRSMAETRPTGP